MEYARCHVWKPCHISHAYTASGEQIFVFHAFLRFTAARRHSVPIAHSRRMPRPAFRYAGKYAYSIYANFPVHVYTSRNGWFFFIRAGCPLFRYVPRMRIHMQLSKSSPSPHRWAGIASGCATNPLSSSLILGVIKNSFIAFV